MVMYSFLESGLKKLRQSLLTQERCVSDLDRKITGEEDARRALPPTPEEPRVSVFAPVLDVAPKDDAGVSVRVLCNAFLPSREVSLSTRRFGVGVFSGGWSCCGSSCGESSRSLLTDASPQGPARPNSLDQRRTQLHRAERCKRLLDRKNGE